MQVGGYDPNFATAQDRDLWDRLLEITKIACLPEVLFQRRMHSSSISTTKTRTQSENAARVAQRAMSRLLGRQVDFELASVIQSENYASADQALLAAALVTELYQRYTAKHKLSFSEARFVRNDYARRLFRLTRKWPRDPHMRGVLLKAVATSPLLIFRWLQKQTRQVTMH